MIEYSEDRKSIDFNQVLNLYEGLGWSNYTKSPEDLEKAIEQSTYVALALKENRLVGLARCISDDVSIHYLQDILVLPDLQGQGVGKSLINMCLKRFSHVRTHMLLTDDEKKQRLFYESVGYKNIRDLKTTPLNAYIKIKDTKID